MLNIYRRCLWLALLISACAMAPSDLQPGLTTYVVQAGDSLAGVAASHGISIAALVAANRDHYPAIATPSATNRLQAGWTLHLPTPTIGRGAALTETPGGASAAEVADEVIESEIVQLTNKARAEAGQAALSVDPGLAAVARQRAREIAGDYSHAGLRALCAACGENLNQAGASDAARRLMAGWLNSPDHRANLLRPDVRRIGVGVYQTQGRVYAVQLFEY